MRAGLNAFNFSRSPNTDVIPVTLAARDSEKRVIGGLVGELRPGWKWLYIAMLWVAEAHRIQGDRVAAASGRDTISFQARGFYEKEGYRLFGVQEDYPPGFQRFYFQKELKD